MRVLIFIGLKIAEAAALAAAVVLWCVTGRVVYYHIWKLDGPMGVGDYVFSGLAGLSSIVAVIYAVFLFGVLLQANWKSAGKLAERRNKEEK